MQSDAVPAWLGLAGIVVGAVLALCSLEFVGPFERDGWKVAAALTPRLVAVVGVNGRGNVAVTLEHVFCSTAVTPGKPKPVYDLAMATKQHKTFCAPCGATTNHVTSYGSRHGGIVASVRCAEHSDLLKQNR